MAHRQRRLLDQLDDFQLFRGRVSHAPSSPTAIVLFFSRRFSRTSSATTSFNAPDSRRRSLTSSEVAARAVSPARRVLPASRNSFDPVIQVLDDPLATAQLGDAVLAAQPGQHNADLLLRRKLAPGG